jgi:hypothetical protein
MSERTTVTLETDVAERLRAEAHATGRSFKDVVNTAIRRGLDQQPDRLPPFIVEARPMGLRDGLSLDDIEGLLDRVDGPDRRW